VKLDRIRLKGADRDQFLLHVSMLCVYSAILLWKIRPFVCLSICPSHSSSVCTYAHIIKLFPSSGRGTDPVFWAHRPPLKIPMGTSSAGVLNTRGLKNLLFFLSKSQFISETVEIGPRYYRSLIGSHRFPIDSCKFQWSWKESNFFSGGSPELRLHGLT